ncbi:MAG: Nucleolysin TIAR [Paramarteilia canceri]
MSSYSTGASQRELQKSTLCIKNLKGTKKDEIEKIFGSFGEIKENREIKSSSGGSQMCFITFTDPSSIQSVLAPNEIRTENGTLLEVSLAGMNSQPQSSYGGYSNSNNHSKSFNGSGSNTETGCIYVGGLGPEIDDAILRSAFHDFGDIVEAKVIRDASDNTSKGFGFVTFADKDVASEAMTAKNGSWINTSTIKTNWAARNSRNSIRPLKFEEMYKNTSQTNTTVYIGGLDLSTNLEYLKRLCERFGKISEIKMHADRGYGFVKYSHKDEACNAIVGINGHKLEGSTKVLIANWGNEGNVSGRGMPTSSMEIPGVNQMVTYPNTMSKVYDQYNPYGMQGGQAVQNTSSPAPNMQYQQASAAYPPQNSAAGNIQQQMLQYYYMQQQYLSMAQLQQQQQATQGNIAGKTTTSQIPGSNLNTGNMQQR